MEASAGNQLLAGREDLGIFFGVQNSAKSGVIMSGERIRITVVKKIECPELAAQYAESGQWEACSKHNVGDVYEVDACSDYPKPEGLCAWAWADMHRAVTVLRYGADQSPKLVDGTMIVSCTDGRRPVVFAVERIQEEPADG